MNLKSMGFIDIKHDKFKTANTPYKIYAELLDETSQKQFFDVLNEPYVTYGALMPDAHAGYTMPIGAVCATKDVVVPQFVGFDIGCGMCAYRTDFTKDEILQNSQEIYKKIVEEIPLGFKKHKNHQSFKCDLPRTEFASHLLNSLGLMQLGTLGGGNHFIEIGYDSNERAWIVIHSGSRGFGHKIATHYMLQAYHTKHPQDKKLEKILNDFKERNQNFKEHNPEGFEKSFEKFKHKQTLELNRKVDLDRLGGIWGLDVKSELGLEYIKDQNFALNFALENRKKMIETICRILDKIIGGDFGFVCEDEERFINKNHNHVEVDDKRGEWIHRKGATHAKKGMMGVIPGNMRDGSFVVRGKGCEESLCSSSHGAGRVMSRVKAKKSINIDEFKESMRGITATVDKNTLDESPFAYKDIFSVMELQKDLVEVVEHIKVLINVKDNSKMRY
jgi:tRNA-splicing ligase RtcB